MNRNVSQLVCQAVLRTHAVVRLGLVLLLCSPALLVARGGAEVSCDAGLVGPGDAVLATTPREHVRPLQHAEGDAGDDQDEPPPWPGRTPAVRPAGASASILLLSDGRERLPDPPEFLQALLRAPPLA